MKTDTEIAFELARDALVGLIAESCVTIQYGDRPCACCSQKRALALQALEVIEKRMGMKPWAAQQLANGRPDQGNGPSQWEPKPSR